ncbi:hypothetical protein AWC38_SpisGene9202 [Stylophora pistillata]|uniref:Uncharacterized protein n=1 Tax=Stylophora pistillata TaxID=50429 RepID=A0A2B4SC39_STYPI|nr:hypothetical protein AWC38_SpisGene9202 [Stylophora pistillata]
MKVGLLLNHIDESCLEIYSNFIYLPERDDPAGGEDKLPAENPDDYATVLAKFDEYFHKRDTQLMLREKFWLHLTRDSTQTFDSWVVTVKERAAECKFPANFYEQATMTMKLLVSRLKKWLAKGFLEYDTDEMQVNYNPCPFREGAVAAKDA